MMMMEDYKATCFFHKLLATVSSLLLFGGNVSFFLWTSSRKHLRKRISSSFTSQLSRNRANHRSMGSPCCVSRWAWPFESLLLVVIVKMSYFNHEHKINKAKKLRSFKFSLALFKQKCSWLVARMSCILEETSADLPFTLKPQPMHSGTSITRPLSITWTLQRHKMMQPCKTLPIFKSRPLPSPSRGLWKFSHPNANQTSTPWSSTRWSWKHASLRYLVPKRGRGIRLNAWFSGFFAYLNDQQMTKKGATRLQQHKHTVDGKNAEPVDMANIQLFPEFHTCQVVLDFFHQQ